MSDREEILDELMQVIGEEGCGVACEAATLFKDEEGWKMILEGFMEPWKLGHSVEEANEVGSRRIVRPQAEDAARMHLGCQVPKSVRRVEGAVLRGQPLAWRMVNVEQYGMGQPPGIGAIESAGRGGKLEEVGAGKGAARI